MRILFVEDHPMWKYGLPNGFRDLGHQVAICTSDEHLPRMLASFRPQLIITMGWTPTNDTLEKQLFLSKHLQAAHVPHVYWATEDPGFMKRFSLPYIRRVKPHFVFTIHRASVPKYKRRKIPAAHLDFGHHRSVHHPTAVQPKYKTQLALVANGYAPYYSRKPNDFRFKTLKHMINPSLSEGYTLNIYGNDWRRLREMFRRPIPRKWLHPYLTYTEANKVYSSADIVLCPQNSPDRLTQRTYEILASGACMITADTPEVRRRFKPGRDCIVTSSEQETFTWLTYYLNNPKKRKEMQQHALRAVARHSYKHRAAYIIQILRKHRIIRSIT
ncbi:CgeB family protein [Paenibacillus arenosi]|uniref:Glycosyltransferase n=1 Tax=Paenibacillus arenosi TaxID=2774142 RepID=A0ABR9AVZ6_9BACL|nr:glycosyltransferase [Paenibacillus arenosi]MBD8497407.1 glycosyltransferase [Paenibacillus arenosi]